MKNKNVTDIALWNEVGGKPQGDSELPDWGSLNNQLNLLCDEGDELCDDVDARDLIGSVKEAADVVVTAIGYIHLAGYNPVAVMDEVNRSNFSKYNETMEQALLSQTHYHKVGVLTKLVSHEESGYWCVKSTKDQVDIHGKEYLKDKLLKGIYYTEADLRGTEYV